MQKTELSSRGFLHDRRWMIVDENGVFLSQRDHPHMCLLETAFRGDKILVRHEREPHQSLEIGIGEHSGEEVEVVVWQDRVQAMHVSKMADDWFSRILGRQTRLVYMHDESIRKVDPDYAKNEDIVSFADGYPILLLGQASLNELNQRAGRSFNWRRFRPNIVFVGAKAHEEDQWDGFVVGDSVFFCTKPCARCQVITIDPRTAEKGTEPTRTLSTYRKKGNQIYFGMNVISNGIGSISVGDEMELL